MSLERIASLEDIMPAVIYTEVAIWRNDREPSESELKYADAKEKVFGEIGTVSGGGIFEGRVNNKTITNLVESTSILVEDKSKKDLNVFENIPVSNAKLIFSEAMQALNGDKEYNRMLWSAVGIVIKEHMGEVSKYVNQEKIVLHTGVDIRDNGIFLVRHENKIARENQLDKLGYELYIRIEDIQEWLVNNYPINDFEKTITDPLKR